MTHGGNLASVGRAILLFFALTLALPAPVFAQQVCRPDRLGLTGCAATRPRPRPDMPFRLNIQALDALIEDSDPANTRGLIPAGRVNHFGDILLDPGERTGGVGSGRSCRADALGNLRCP